jgi:chemotaxis protein histidine kinase CheA
MGDDIIETLWREFGIESEEHLDLIEPILGRAADAATPPEDIAQLFRSFHTVKGLARAMDVKAMEGLSHHSENILGVVRDGRAELAGPVVDALLRAVDALRHMREQAIDKRGDVAADDALLGQLQTIYAGLQSGQAPVSARADTMAPPATAIPAAPPSAELPTSSVPLHEDTELLSFLADTMREQLPVIADAISGDLDAERRTAVLDAADMLANATEQMGFELFAENLRQLPDALPAEGAGGDGPDPALVALLDEIRAQAAIVGEAIGGDAGAAALGAAMAERLKAGIESALAELDDVAAVLADGLSEGDESGIAEEIAARAGRARAVLGASGAERAARLLSQLEDAFQRMTTREVVPSEALAAASRAALAAVSHAKGADLSEERARPLAEGLRLALAGPPPGEGASGLGQLPIKPELVEILTTEQIEEILAAVKAGTHLYEITVMLDGDVEAGNRFIAWLEEGARPITNRTLLSEESSAFEFLVLADLPRDDVERRIAEIDPAGACVSAAFELGADGGTTPLLLPGRPAEAVATPGAAEARGGGDRGQSANILRVTSETLDKLMAEIGSALVLATSAALSTGDKDNDVALGQLRRFLDQTESDDADDLRTALERVTATHILARDLTKRLETALLTLHGDALELRVVPVDTVLRRLPRVVRDLVKQQGKRVRLDIEGGEVRIDKSIVEQLADSLLHMVRNAIDHGIELPADRRAAGKSEEARLLIRAAQRGSEIAIEVGDNGRGLDVDRIRATAVKRGLLTEIEAQALPPDEAMRLIFRPGFSTAAQVTETSGRGVGMDVVQTAAIRLGGRVDIRSRKGEGTTFTLRLPLSAALQNALLIESQGQMLAIPDRHLAEIVRADEGEARRVAGQRGILLRDRFLPVFPIEKLLGRADVDDPGQRPIVVLTNGRERIGIAVDRLHRRQELFLKELHPRLARIPGVGGATILGDGSVVLVLDGDGLLHLARRHTAEAARLAN